MTVKISGCDLEDRGPSRRVGAAGLKVDIIASYEFESSVVKFFESASSRSR